MAEDIAPWLERELTRQLGPVTAPDSLWDRIQEPQRPPRARSFRWYLWPVAAALLLMVSSELVWQFAIRDPLADMEKLAAQQLHGLEDLDIHSENPAEIRGWLKSKANIDIDLPRSSSARLRGARMMSRWGSPVAAVAYRVGNDDATLLVSRKHMLFSRNTASKHEFSRMQSGAGVQLYSWRSPGQVYTIASSITKDPQAACLLCHSSIPD